MKNKKSTSKKLNAIAILSAITICSSIGVTAIQANADTTDRDRPTKEERPIKIERIFNRLIFGTPQVELNINSIGKSIKKNIAEKILGIPDAIRDAIID